MRATVDNALGSLSPLIAAGVDGVFLDGVVDFDIGCSETPCNGNCHPTADINCTHASCRHTPQRPWSELAAEFVRLYHSWFLQLQAVHPHLVWVNKCVSRSPRCFARPSVSPTLLAGPTSVAPESGAAALIVSQLGDQRGAFCQYQYHLHAISIDFDQHSGLTDIYLHFVISIQILMPRSR
jgi:hypothetical protein